MIIVFAYAPNAPNRPQGNANVDSRDLVMVEQSDQSVLCDTCLRLDALVLVRRRCHSLRRCM